ncbi:MAG: haloacid dehalogenase type II [Gammaproteobacteria bacterium]|jgi:2-haloacid dehalogenase|nr:haloacid dehalogenase type II [Gammaproteobacteria bacterium]MBT3858925.1 haloacid dehalogenase type II [Gammaproteobacteria bacterium]MBT3988253.1 haloacid dehalogenase type II [Gammaproteobacteria bacterium]MBT4256885.1 haloacid dehalogenase type II [Gammaproteobacteria bacterium]MBT4582523.1 haloacid dehalogenase type II [Gammaproteobacteria bacterium]
MTQHKSASASAHANLSRRRFLQSTSIISTALLPGISLAANSSVADNVKALTFDVFGTVVDWRASIIREGQLLAANKGYDVDWAEFADRWRSGYGPAMNKVRTGELPWMKIDDLHRMILDDLVIEYGLEGMTAKELDDFNRAWHRLSPWPDTVAGLNRLKTKYVITTLSNGNVSLLTNMAKNAGMPWDAILSAELSGHYKPDPEAYLKAADLLSLAPEQVMMVAAHPGDLRGAARAGLRTAYVIRPLERGPGRPVNRNPDGEFDYTADSFLDLAKQLGA